jgi:hypothetical protein
LRRPSRHDHADASRGNPRNGIRIRTYESARSGRGLAETSFGKWIFFLVMTAGM